MVSWATSGLQGVLQLAELGLAPAVVVELIFYLYSETPEELIPAGAG